MAYMSADEYQDLRRRDRLNNDAGRAQIAREMLAAIEGARFNHFGVRIEDGRTFAVGEWLPNSRIWDDDVPTEDDVGGVSTVGIDAITADDIMGALYAAGNYDGDYIVLVGANAREVGQDSGEHILRGGTSLGTWDRYAPTNKTGAHAIYG